MYDGPSDVEVLERKLAKALKDSDARHERQVALTRAYLENLTSTQARCTSLLQEARDARAAQKRAEDALRALLAWANKS